MTTKHFRLNLIGGFMVQCSLLSPALAMNDPVQGRWLTRDPIGYAGGSFNLYEFAQSDPISLDDPFGDTSPGHHPVPQCLLDPESKKYIGGELSKGAKELFKQFTTGATTPSHLSGTYGGVTHPQYTEAVKKAFEEFMKKNGITSSNKMTPKQAKGFLKIIINADQGSAISKFNRAVAAQVLKQGGGIVGKKAAQGLLCKLLKGLGTGCSAALIVLTETKECQAGQPRPAQWYDSWCDEYVYLPCKEQCDEDFPGKPSKCGEYIDRPVSHAKCIQDCRWDAHDCRKEIEKVFR